MFGEERSRVVVGLLRFAGLGLTIVAGLLAIIGSGGGAVGFPDTSCLQSGTCPIPPMPPPRTAYIGPSRVTVQVGGTVVFQASTDVDQPVYQWCRQPVAGAACTVIANETGSSLTLAGVNLADDGTLIGVTASGTNGTANAFSRLAVSSMPGVVFEDGDFALPDWSVAPVTEPATGGPAVDTTRADSGGHPGAYRSASYTFQASPSSVRVFYAAAANVYDPSVSGAIYTLDFSEDCFRSASSNLMGYTAPMLEQGGRRFVASDYAFSCQAGIWTAVRRASLDADAFTMVDGPACDPAQTCPDFSSTGAPIQLGLMGGAALTGGLVPPVTVEHGFDNWKVTVWRH